MDVFEEYADEYDRWFDEHRDDYMSELARIRRMVPSPDSHAVEIGVGSGRFASDLGVPLGLDTSLALCRLARRRGIEVVHGRAEAVPFKEGSCSSVLMVTVICFLEEPSVAFGEIHRILKPGGLLTLAFIEREGQIARKYLHEEGKHRFLSHARFHSYDEVQTLLGKTGFQIEKVDSRAGFSVIAARRI